MSRRRDIERAVKFYDQIGSTFNRTLDLAYDLGRIAGMREAAKWLSPGKVGDELRAAANREARKLRRTQ